MDNGVDIDVIAQLMELTCVYSEMPRSIPAVSIRNLENIFLLNYDINCEITVSRTKIKIVPTYIFHITPPN